MMKKFTLSLAAVAAFALLTFDAGTAEAAHGFRGFGIHLGGRNVHLDIGRPHGSHFYDSYQTSFYAPAPRVWHDTSHYDYDPGGYVPHRNHCDYVPGHFDYHRSGHWEYGYGGRY